MRTTIDLDEELLRTAKSLAAAKGQSLSRVISDLAWKGLSGDMSAPAPCGGHFPVLPRIPGARLVTPDHVAELLHRSEDEDGV